MSIWMELMCDERRDGVMPDHITAICFTNRNQNVMGRSKNISTSYNRIQKLEEQARKEGWLINRGRYICPGCREVIYGHPAQVDQAKG